MDSHYTEISSIYDNLYEPIHQAYTPIITNKLQLTPDDLLLDIGAATGQQAHLLADLCMGPVSCWLDPQPIEQHIHVGLKNPVTCIEPCQALFEHASKLDGIVSVVQKAEKLCDNLAKDQGENQCLFNKILLCSVVQHIHDIIRCLGHIIDYLPKNGVCLILNQPKVGSRMPFTLLQLKDLEQKRDVLDDILPYVKNRDDVITEVTNEEPSIKIPKSRWYYMIRNRFWSSLRRYTDEEIEESIKDLDNGRFKGVKNDELITVVDKLVGIKITKR